jgi:hypothetical protein
MWAERTLLLRGRAGLIDIRERLGHLLVFYYNMENICYLFSLKLDLYIRFFTCLHTWSY